MKKIWLDSQLRLRSGWQILLAIVIILLSSIVGSLLDMAWESFPLSFVAYPLGYAGTALVLSYLTLRYGYRGLPTQGIDCYPPKKRGLLQLLSGLLCGALCFSAVVLPLYLTGVYQITYHGTSAIHLVSSFALFISVGIVEEIVTRGLIQHALLRFGLWPALFLTSITFGAMHLANFGVTPNAILGIIFAGLLLGISMYATGSILFPIGFHITWNWVQGSFYGIPVSGNEALNSIFTTTINHQNGLLTGGAFGAEASLSCLIILAIASLLFYMYGSKNGNFAYFQIPKTAISHSVPLLPHLGEEGPFCIVLQNAGQNKMQVIKIIRNYTGLKLAEAKEKVDTAPSVIVEHISNLLAEQLKQELENLGAIVMITEDQI